MSLHGERIPPVERFRLAVCQAFPEQAQRMESAVEGCIRSAWRQLAGALDMPVAVFARGLGEQMGLVVAGSLAVSPRMVSLLPAAGVRKYPCLPLRLHENELEVAVANPWDEELIRFVHFGASVPVRLLLAPPEEIDEAIRIAFSVLSDTSSKRVGVFVPGEDSPQHEGNEPDGAQMARRLLQEAAGSGARELHVQPFLGGGQVRARIDGLLRRIALLPESSYRQLCRHLKISAGMDPDNDRMPRDGCLSIRLDGHEYDLRLSSLPSRGGECIVIRFPDRSRAFHLAGNGFSITEVHRLRRLVHRQAGLILLSGPCDSGKTSTLHALLGELDAAHRNIITVENPVECVLPGLLQIGINERAGLTFAPVLRSVLRQDPDVLLVGEIDDRDTAAIVCQAALTGRLVLSTLHAGDAPGTIRRLLDLGISPSVLADILTGVVSQRLCRRLCEHCRAPVAADAMHAEESAFRKMTGMSPLYRPVGCEHCGHTGFHGRLPLIGILESSPSLQQAIATNSLQPGSSVQYRLASPGSLASSAVCHIVAGETSVGECVRVIGEGFWPDLAEEYRTAVPEVVFTVEEMAGGQSPGVLIAGPEGMEDEWIAAELERAGFSAFRARTPVAFRDHLQAHMNIVCVVITLDDAPGNDELFESVQRARVGLFPDVLPAVMLLPADPRDPEEVPRAADPLTIRVTRPLAAMDVVHLVRRALSSRPEKRTVSGGWTGITFADSRSDGDACGPVG